METDHPKSRSNEGDLGGGIPKRGDRMPARFWPGPHPALKNGDELMAECGFRAQRRSGPGGQHRNKTSSGVFLHHDPTGITAEATERRSQADNRIAALSRLRHQLAVDLRTASPLDVQANSEEEANPEEVDEESRLRRSYAGGPLRIGRNHADRPAVLALLLNDLHAAGGQPRLVASLWGATTSGVVRMVKSHSPAFVLLNAIRSHHRRGPLR